VSGRAYEPDRIRVEEMHDWTRGFSEDLCAVCGCRLKEHAPVSGYAWLVKLCDGDLVRL
jgi:hypothetical protein